MEPPLKATSSASIQITGTLETKSVMAVEYPIQSLLSPQSFLPLLHPEKATIKVSMCLFLLKSTGCAHDSTFLIFYLFMNVNWPLTFN